MHSELRWVGQKQEIALIESRGAWDSLDLLQHADEILSVSPRYLIWNPTNVIFLAENSVTNLERNAPERFKIFGVVSEILNRDEQARFIIVSRNHSSVFDVIQTIYEKQGKGHQLLFLSSQDDAMTYINDQQN